MSVRKQRLENPPDAEHLARALRSGLELRWSIPSRSDGRDPFPPRGNVRPFLERYADSLHYTPPPRRQPLLRLLGMVRSLLRKLLGPWLDVQTHFNLSTVSVIEQVEQRVQSLEEANRSLRQTVETLEKTLLARTDHELNRQAETLEEGLRLRVNQELSRYGEIARAGLWFNPAVNVWLDHDGPRVTEINERILEPIFIHTHLPRPPARLLALGCAESTNAIEMASLGFEVVGVDSRRLHLSHPNFTMIQASIAELPFEDESFDAAVALSTFSIGEDEQGVGEAFRVLKRGGRFLVTVPFGRPAKGVYTRAQLDRLLGAFRLVERAYGVRDGDAWSFTLDEQRAEQADSGERVSAVCLLALEKP
ncbi:MAG TPA: methyltransferase domain-containing protein [Gemmataceae bacterium]|jgi:SAM-dependent methyltransferase